MVGPFGRDISRAQKIGGPTREHGFNFLRLVAIIVNLISSHFVFRVQCGIFPKSIVFTLAMTTLYMVLLLEESENPQTKSTSENYNAEHLNDDGANTSFFSPLFSSPSSGFWILRIYIWIGLSPFFLFNIPIAKPFFSGSSISD